MLVGSRGPGQSVALGACRRGRGRIENTLPRRLIVKSNASRLM
jgi:hypothetical protein